MKLLFMLKAVCSWTNSLTYHITSEGGLDWSQLQPSQKTTLAHLYSIKAFKNQFLESEVRNDRVQIVPSQLNSRSNYWTL